MEQERFQGLNQEIMSCTRCRLALSRTHAVPGEGAAGSGLFFIGEGPGRHEDLSGRPFVGRAGSVLEDLLSSIGLVRDQVFITSIVKCRPPGNRTPKKDEIAACAGYLDRQIDLLSPGLIVPMGSLASDAIFSRFGIPGGSIGNIHGKVFQVATQEGRRQTVIPVYHPAAMTHNPRLKGALFEDFRIIGELIAQRGGTGRDTSMPGQPKQG